MTRLRTFPLPSTLTAERLASQGVDYMDAAAIGVHLRASGLDDTAAKLEVMKAAWAVRTDSPEVMMKPIATSTALHWDEVSSVHGQP